MRYFYNLFNRPHRYDLHRNQDEEFQKKNQFIQSSKQKSVADEEKSRNYEKDTSGTQSANCKNTSYNVTVLDDRFHENDLIGPQSARCNMTCDKVLSKDILALSTPKDIDRYFSFRHIERSRKTIIFYFLVDPID